MSNLFFFFCGPAMFIPLQVHLNHRVTPILRIWGSITRCLPTGNTRNNQEFLQTLKGQGIFTPIGICWGDVVFLSLREWKAHVVTGTNSCSETWEPWKSQQLTEPILSTLGCRNLNPPPPASCTHPHLYRVSCSYQALDKSSWMRPRYLCDYVKNRVVTSVSQYSTFLTHFFTNACGV